MKGTDTMAFKILPIAKVYGYAGQYADNRDIKVYLGLRPNQKLSHDMRKQVTVTLLDGRETALYVVPSTPAPEGPNRWRNKSSAHRTFALCPDCLKPVPAGRTHQHKCKGN